MYDPTPSGWPCNCLPHSSQKKLSKFYLVASFCSSPLKVSLDSPNLKALPWSLQGLGLGSDHTSTLSLSTSPPCRYSRCSGNTPCVLPRCLHLVSVSSPWSICISIHRGLSWTPPLQNLLPILWRLLKCYFLSKSSPEGPVLLFIRIALLFSLFLLLPVFFTQYLYHLLHPAGGASSVRSLWPHPFCSLPQLRTFWRTWHIHTLLHHCWNLLIATCLHSNYKLLKKKAFQVIFYLLE